MLKASALAPLIALSLSATAACAAPCEKVHSSYDAFLDATAPSPARVRAETQAAHLSLSVPYELIDATIARELGDLPTLKLPLPAVSGTNLGSLALSVDGVRTRAAPTGELGFRVLLGLAQGKRSVLTVNVDARIRPRLDPGSGRLIVALEGSDIIALEPSIDAAGRKRLGAWIGAQLPAAARMLLDDATLGELAGELTDELMTQATARLRRELLDDLGELVRFELDLPEALPLAAIALRSGERYLDIDLRTTLPVDTPLPAVTGTTRTRAADLHPNLIQVVVAGDAAAALANEAVRSGRLPGRWTLEGEADPRGELYAGVGWVEGAADPLELLLWKMDEECAHVVLRGRPVLRVEGSALELGAEQAKVDAVIGSFKVRAGLFFSKTVRRGLSLVEQTTASTEVELAGEAMALQIHAAEVRADQLVLGLRLSPAAVAR
ncbi:hypothetical protein G6O69_31215 [Pseudenhygromyxa sp. WMMC2535]|uniref:hypothetical protein n=1 Tax=Pseudenhygromyxa sp. WMMC2535 TaxID=2712867 RepID=UPI00155763DD|nr:hypothetical protein [Pseudenhygromyxa sp. WMMC2535]NVB42334.1 hypothetical protein [Pseudenhygromyxa sp. WMMC2535]